jgi:hypothetical protein
MARPGMPSRSTWCEREERRAIGVRKVILVCHAYGAVIPRLRRRNLDSADMDIERLFGGCRTPSPASRGIGHEAHAVDSFAVVEAVNLDAAVTQREGSAAMHFDEGIARRGATQGDLAATPLLPDPAASPAGASAPTVSEEVSAAPKIAALCCTLRRSMQSATPRPERKW